LLLTRADAWMAGAFYPLLFYYADEVSLSASRFNQKEAIVDYRVVELDFIERSLAILEQYDKFVLPCVPKDEQYEVTLLLNMLLGLIVVPYEHRNREQPKIVRQGDKRFPLIFQRDDVPISDLSSEWGLDQMQTKKFLLDGKEVEPNERTLRKIVAMFRHSMAHSRFGAGGKLVGGMSVDYQVSPDQPTRNIIRHINFKNKYQGIEFEATISVKGLRAFATKIAQNVLLESQRRTVNSGFSESR